MELRNEYLYFLSDKVKREPFVLLLPNDLFKKNNDLDIPAEHKAFANSMYPLVKLTNWKRKHLTISKIKELWGYAPHNKTLNKLVKSGGILDSNGITRTVVQGIKETSGATKLQYKEITFDIDIKRGFFRVDPEIMLFSMTESKKVGTIGFTIYMFLCKAAQVQGKGKNCAKTAFSYIAGEQDYVKKPFEHISNH